MGAESFVRNTVIESWSELLRSSRSQRQGEESLPTRRN